MGHKVGRGECWDLPYYALQVVGAKTPHDLGTDLYVWGQEIPLSEAKPGDILQFENVVIERHWSDGSWYKWDFPKHSAIIESVNGVYYTLLNENYDDKKIVTRLKDIPLGDANINSGSIKAYRPIKKDSK